MKVGSNFEPDGQLANFSMQKKLNPKKVVEEIDSLLLELEKRLKNKKEFEDLHKKSLKLCRIIFQIKKDYKAIDVPYPIYITIVSHDSFGNKTGKEIQIPNEEECCEQKEELLTKIADTLHEASEVYSLKLKLIGD